MINVTQENFASEVLNSEVPVLVDFWADWCPPCRMLAPILETLDEETGELLKIVKVDADAEPELTAANGVIALPTLMLFKNGEVVQTRYGAMPLADLVRAFEPHYKG